MRRAIKLALVAGALVAGALVVRAVSSFWFLFWALMFVALVGGH